jgi:hypothetical protein
LKRKREEKQLVDRIGAGSSGHVICVPDKMGKGAIAGKGCSLQTL